MDLFPEATVFRNIRKNKLSLIEGKRAGVFVFAEPQRERLPLYAPAACHGFAPALSSDDPFLRGSIRVKEQVFVFWALENDGCFPPMTN